MFVTTLTEWTSLLKKRNFFDETQKEVEKDDPAFFSCCIWNFFQSSRSGKKYFFCRQQRRDKDKVKQDLNENALDKKVFYLAFRSYSEATKEEMEVWEKNLWKIMLVKIIAPSL